MVVEAPRLLKRVGLLSCQRGRELAGAFVDIDVLRGREGAGEQSGRGQRPGPGGVGHWDDGSAAFDEVPDLVRGAAWWVGGTGVQHGVAELAFAVEIEALSCTYADVEEALVRCVGDDRAPHVHRPYRRIRGRHGEALGDCETAGARSGPIHGFLLKEGHGVERVFLREQ
ncbi:hypothetical protein [Streptomyces sirii]|uniref:hypothetical protein n=1 Tax=Streptomyces sirii TaxID=3127701 RepID=UPI003D36690E